MSEYEKRPRDVYWLLAKIHRRSQYEVSGQHGNRARTVFARAMVLVITLPVLIPVLWRALPTMPTALVVLIGLSVVVRVGRWYWRR